MAIGGNLLRPKQPGPDFRMRLGEEKAKWIAAAKSNGFKTLAGFIKWAIEPYIEELENKRNK